MPKLRSLIYRLFLPIACFPIRLLRLIFHLLFPFLFWVQDVPQFQLIKRVLDWFFMIPFYLIDLLGICELYEIINELINWKIRDLNHHESLLIDKIFNKNSVDKTHLRISPANFLSKKFQIAYVSFRQINFHNYISDDVFIHEVVHLWQYQKFGAVYIYFAWKAQLSEEGYNYGQVDTLIKAFRGGKLFHQFNFEQQAEIIQDYYKNMFYEKRISASGKDFSIYVKYKNEMNNLT